MLSVSRLCTRGIPRAPFTNLSLSTQRALHSPLQKRPSDFLRILRETSAKWRTTPGLSTQSGAVSFRYASAVNKKTNRLVGTWLFTCSGMVFIAVALGGITRLTESGLSMVTWKLLGEKMPVSEGQWIEEFERYKQYPEYKLMNQNMTLEEFKKIWWMEYVHRMWGRLIGAAFALPAAYFWYRGYLKPGMKARILVLGSLIGAQGLMGWYMVKSGLEDRFEGPSDVPRVSQYRLAAHLGLAFLLYAGFLHSGLDHLLPAKVMPLDWFGKKILTDKHTKALVKFKRMAHGTKALVFLTAISGAFVAGLDAGLIYNEFPRMGRRFIPKGLLEMSPMLRNFTENPTTVQWDHRVLGITTLTLITIMALKSRKIKLPGRASTAALVVLGAGYLQVILGISTLLHHVPVSLAASHQSGSMLLLSTVIWLCHELKHVRKLPK
ncbi:cytochrome c oxidase assembly protein COX15 homolog [Diachasma alloeum]|uniref:cytochrome c oxidase assembly protein COX15 homolog n=1 Tax=Diachasma alloeum TaxID=454923 RepID=UPI0007384D2C|nr:cytochrome c oxidase assembly protein COX15 homolog [Diachasma alloeum]XP_015110580.1 cytochrome c oxidase assembly protein COX15 homolog [Diachasma alloeum]XP_015110581.1 cytochrome c oxidase assembly protein COX15 homolog [Diachasma alloeum]